MTTPLHDPIIEKAILGCAITSKPMLDTALDFIGSKDVFFDPKHIVMWDAVKKIIDDDRAVDMLTLTQKIRSMNKSDVVGAAYIAETTFNVTADNEKNLITHLLITIEYWVKRRLLEISTATNQDCQREESDALDVLSKLRNELKDIEESIGRAKVVDIAKSTETVVKDILSIAFTGRKPTGIVKTGFKELDELYGGANNGDFIVVGARPAMGKTSFAMCWAKNVAKQGGGVGFISIEMPTEQLVTRLLSIESGINNNRLQKEAHLMTKQELDRLENAGKNVALMPLKIVDDPSVNATKMRALVKTFKEMGCKIVFIDYLQIMRPDGKAQANSDTKFLDDITRDLKQTAREYQIPIVALSQLSRSVEETNDKRPTLNHLRMSGQIEANADAVFFLYRPEYYRLEMPSDLGGGNSFNKAVVIIAKHRNGGVGDVVLDFIKDTTEFRSIGDDLWKSRISHSFTEEPEDEDVPF